MAWLRLSLRRLRDERVPTAALAGLVLVTAFVFAVAPRLLTRVADDSVRLELSQASGFDRNVQLYQETRLVDPQAPLDLVDKTGKEFASAIPPSVQALFTAGDYVIDSVRWRIRAPTSDPAFVRLRVQQHVADHITYVAGRAPTGATQPYTIPDAPAGTPPSSVIEVGLSTATARALDLEVGQTVLLEIDPSDSLAGRAEGGEKIGMQLVGTFDVPAPKDPYWLDDPSIEHIVIRSLSSETKYLDATAVLAPDAYLPLLRITEPSHYPSRITWRHFVDPSRIDAARLDSLLVDLRRLESVFPTVAQQFGEAPALRSGLLLLLDHYRTRWTATSAVLTLIAVGPAAVAAAALALVTLLVVARRRAALGLYRSRGGSVAQIAGAAGIEALLVMAPAAAIAAALAIITVPGGATTPSVIAAAIVGAVTVVLLLAAVMPSAVATPRGPGRESTVVRRAGPRRLAAEALVIGLAVVGAYLLRERGVAGTSSTRALGAADPYIAAVPALVGVAAGLIVVRVFPFPMRALAWLAARARGLVPVLAMRRVTRGGSGGAVLLVLLATAAMGAFCAATLVHIDRAAGAVGWQAVGASYRLAAPSGPLPAGLDPAKLPGVEAAAGAYQVQTSLANLHLPLQLVALDVDAYRSVVAGTPADANLPPDMSGRIDAATPVPAVISTRVAAGTNPIKVGDVFEMVVEGTRQKFRAVAIRDSFPTLPNQPFAIASRQQLRAARPDAYRLTWWAFVRAPATGAAPIRDAVEREGGGAVLTSQAEVSAAVHDAPLVRALTAGLVLAAAVSAAYAALAVSAALALAGAARAVEVAHLRTLGLARRSAVSLVVAEHGPSIAVAFAAGVALGVALFAVLKPGLGLGALIGSPVDVAVGIEPVQLLLILGVVVIIAALGIGLGAALQRSAAPAAAVRRGFD